MDFEVLYWGIFFVYIMKGKEGYDVLFDMEGEGMVI